MIGIALEGPEEAAGIGALIGGTLFLTYSVPDPETGQNPTWATFGYPGPILAPSPKPRPIEPLVPECDELTLEADVVVVGSGAGGGVIAGSLAQSGMKVVVLEAGAYYDESELPMLELWAYQNLYLRGGAFPTADNNIGLQAGAGLGGGTTINWTNCLRTTDWVREQWANEFGLEGVDGPEYDRHLDAVLERIGANEECSDYNGPTLRLKDGAEKLGLNFRRIVRNADPADLQPGDGRLQRLRRPQRLQADHRQDLPTRRGREGRRDPRPHQRSPGDHRERQGRRGRRPASRTPRPAAAPTSPCARRTSSSPAARSSRRRCCCARGSAGRRWATTSACTRPAACSASTTRTRKPGGGRRRPA